MITFQDYERFLAKGGKIIDFVYNVIKEHKDSEDYKIAYIADQYNRRRNVTISNYQKILYSLSGEAVPDNYSANFKLKTNQFNRLITQLNQYELGNGATWGKKDTGEKLGEDFDSQLQDAGEKALVHKVSFGFWNKDHVEIFSFLEFAPLYDEENGSMRVGVRFWQLSKDKPLRATLYEEDGYTDYIWYPGEQGKELHPKRDYIIHKETTNIGGTEIVGGENYASFPIVPFWGNKYHQSEFVGMREDIDAYDLIKSGFANDLDDVSQIYWVIQNAGGMDDIDLREFIERLKRNHIAKTDDDQTISPQTINIPVEARETLLKRLRSDIYEDFMALDTKNIADGAVTATQIEAGYEPMNAKADKYEYCVLNFISGILALAGIEDNASFTRSVIVNSTEMIGNVLASAQYLSTDYVVKKLLTLLGDGDQADAVLKEMDKEDMQRFGAGGNQEEQTEDVNNAE